MNEGDGSLNGIPGPKSGLFRPKFTPIWYQIGLFDYDWKGTLYDDVRLCG